MQFKLIEKNTPRWIIFLIDIFICLGSIMLAYQVRFNFRVPEKEIEHWAYVIPTVLLVRVLSFYISKIYQGIIRYTSTRDALRVFYTITVGSIFMAVANMGSRSLLHHYH